MIKPKKSLGQNFLKDKSILKKIADFAETEKEDFVIEVGPGEGSLTQFLLEKAKKVIAVEKDEKMVEFLKEKFAKEIKTKKLKIIRGDILNLEFKQNYILVGNIPYYITGALFKKFLEAENQPKSITFVVQKEVAERIMAKRRLLAGKQGKESVLSISIKVYGTPKFGGIIKAGSFNPKPKVDSAIISIRDISRERFEARQKSSCSESPRVSSLRSARLSSQDFSVGKEFEQKFFEILRKGFAHKRKLLMKNLGATKEIFKKCSMPEKARAEDLSVEDWLCLAKTL